jgi:hypothetical protein
MKGALEVVRMADKAEAFQSVTQSACAAVPMRQMAPNERREVRQEMDKKEFILKML